MYDRLFILCASVGLTVLAPNPDTWCEGWPGSTDIRLPEPGVVAPDLPARGDRAPDADTLF